MYFHLYFYFLLVSVAHASTWFGSEVDYTKWSLSELRSWLENHNIKVPSHFAHPLLLDLVRANLPSTHSPSAYADQSRTYVDAGRQWTHDQYNRAQRVFEDITESSFDKWDESRLRAFLLEQGVVAPSGPREQLVLLAKQKYRTFTDAAAYYSSLASAAGSSACAGVTDTAYSASKSISSAAAQATSEVGRAFDESKDYVYSTWDDNRLRTWLEEHGVVEAKKASTRSDLIKLVNDYYRKTSKPLWQTWSDSYMREWLVSRNLLEPTYTPSRSTLIGQLDKYYYSVSDKVWDTWTDSDLKAWLVAHGLLKSDAQKKRDELVKMVQDSYLSTLNSIWDHWSDSDMRRWLVEHGYIDERSAVKKKRDELVQLIDNKYHDVSSKSASYLVWPDARLRVYLREKGISESALPTTRPGLLQETRIRWVQASTRAETIFAKLKEIVNSGVEVAEAKLARVLEVLSGQSHDTACQAPEKAEQAREHAHEKARGGREYMQEAVKESLRGAGESIKWSGEKMKSAGDEL
ncbi:hypothetical protein F5I97DRAFT_1939653 [Phlebopus sp. FC_14]|nr:hypothetical protein F5I97DRAFT_1939653 [Phlebopus sp. FC_14]